VISTLIVTSDICWTENRLLRLWHPALPSSVRTKPTWAY